MIENKADEMLYHIGAMYVNNNYLLSTVFVSVQVG